MQHRLSEGGAAETKKNGHIRRPVLPQRPHNDNPVDLLGHGYRWAQHTKIRDEIRTVILHKEAAP